MVVGSDGSSPGMRRSMRYWDETPRTWIDRRYPTTYHDAPHLSMYINSYHGWYHKQELTWYDRVLQPLKYVALLVWNHIDSTNGISKFNCCSMRLLALASHVQYQNIMSLSLTIGIDMSCYAFVPLQPWLLQCYSSYRTTSSRGMEPMLEIRHREGMDCIALARLLEFTQGEINILWEHKCRAYFLCNSVWAPTDFTYALKLKENLTWWWWWWEEGIQCTVGRLE